ncbi:MAG: hypothetical protein RR338_06090 [Clostridia bacterium]
MDAEGNYFSECCNLPEKTSSHLIATAHKINQVCGFWLSSCHQPVLAFGLVVVISQFWLFNRTVVISQFQTQLGDTSQ